MAYALVGSAGAVNATAVTTANTPSYGQSPTAGNLLICFCAGGSANTAPTTPSGWSVGAQSAGVASTAGSATIFYQVATGGDTAPTIASATSVLWFCQLYEFSGGATTTPLDQSGANHSTTASSPLVATAGGADSALGELVLAIAICHYSSAATKTLTATLNNGATATSATNNATSIINHYGFSYGVTTGNSGADTFSNAATTLNLTGTNVAIASFLLAAGGGPPPFIPQVVAVG